MVTISHTRRAKDFLCTEFPVKKWEEVSPESTDAATLKPFIVAKLLNLFIFFIASDIKRAI